MFLKIFARLLKIYGEGYKLKFALMGIFSAFMVVFEFAGLALIFPFVILLSGKSAQISLPFLENFFKSADSNSSLAAIICLLIILIFIFKDVFMIFCVRYQNDVISDLQLDIYKDIVINLIKAPFLKTKTIPYGDKCTLLNLAIYTSLWGFMQKTVVLISNGVVAACILGFLLYKFFLPALLTAGFLFVFVYFEQLFFKKRAKRIGEKILEAQRIQSEIFEYTFKGIKEVKTAKNREFFIDELVCGYEVLNTNTKLSNSNGQYPVYVTEIGLICAFGILSALIFFIQKTDSSLLIPSLAVVAAIVLRLVPLINKLQSSMYSINQSRPQIVWFLDMAEKINEWAKEGEKEEGAKIEFKDKIVLKDVYFSYNGENSSTQGLFDINLEICRGDFVGIVGASGAGKTTLCDILTGLIQKDKGHFFVDNVEITKENIRSLQKEISILPQEFFLMPNSVLKNVYFGEIEDRERAIEALKEAEIYDKISNLDLPPELSIGQKHRIALARALYRNSSILFLDEATSSLDIETEDKVSKSISKLKGEKTIIAIAHRLSTLKNCDYILYMKDGKIIDKGTFVELKEKHKDFENLIKLSNIEL